MEDSSAHLANSKNNVDQTGQNNSLKKPKLSIEKLLGQSTPLLIETLDNFQDGIFALDKNWTFTYLNKHAAGIIGLKPQDIVGKNLWKVFSQVKDTTLGENYRLAMQTQQIRRFEAKGPGVEKWFDITLYPSKEGIIVHWKDITESKKAQEAVKASEERLNMAQKIAHVGSWEYFAKEDKALWSTELFNIFGLKPQPYGPDVNNYVKLIYPDDREKINTEMEKLLFNANVGRMASFDYRILLPDNSIRILHSERIVREVEDGKAIRIMGIEQDVTEHKQAEEALIETKEKLQNILNSMDDGVTLVDLDGKIIDTNEASLKQLGLTKEELVGANVYDIVVPEDRKSALEGSFKVLETGKTVNQIRILRKDNSVFFAEISVTALYDKNKKPTAFLGVTRDITERKKTEEMLRENEQLYKAVFDNSQDAFQLVELLYDENGKPVDGRVLKVNAAFEAQTGIKATDVVGKRVKEHVFSAEPFWFEAHDKVLKTSKSIHVERYNQYTKRYYDVYYFPYSKNIVGGLSRDITERKVIEEQLKQRTSQLALERERFFSMLEDLPVMVCLITPDYQVTYANRLFREKFGESAGRPCYVYCGAQSAPCSMCESLVPLKTGKPHHWVAHFPSGMVVEAYDFPFTDVDGKRMVLEADIDITQRIKLEKQLQEKERMAAIGETAGMVGHDLRNPLQSIIGEVYLAKNELKAIPDSEHKTCVQESIQAIAEQISYMDKIVSDLQTFVKPVEAHKQTVQLKPLITGLLEQTNIPKNIPTNLQIDDTLTAKTDPQLLKRVLINLVTNAMQAMPQGGKLTIRAYSDDKGEVKISVQDTGIGIPKEVKPKIFTLLFTTKSKGQGFGLAVCKRIIEAQGGTISFESEEGKGTKFVVKLPTS